MRVTILTTDNREHHRRYDLTTPYFGPAIESVLQGFSRMPELEIHVVSCTQKPMRSPEKIAENTWFHLLDVPKIGWLKTGYQGCIRAVRRKVREIQPDIVHGQGTERDCAISAVFSGFPSVVTIHGNMRSIASINHAPMFSYDWCAARLERFTLPRTFGVLCNSAFTESAVRSLARRTWRVPNALQDEFFNTPLPQRSTSPSLPRILNIGAVVRHKRQLEVLDGAERLHRAGHRFELCFIGVANPRSEYGAMFLRKVAAAEQKGFAKFLGVKSLAEIIALLDSADALVHVPSAESFGLVVGEALARNRKVFAANVGGVPDIVTGAEGAELFDMENVEELVAAMERWINEACPQPKSAATEMRRRYHPDVIAQHHLEIYRELKS